MKRLARFIDAIIVTTVHVAVSFTKFAKEKPGQVLAPIGVLFCSALLFMMESGTVFSAIIMVIQFVFIVIQFRSLCRTISADRIRKLKEDKERLAQFIDHYGPNGLVGSIRFLVPFKNPWYSTLYYKIKNITRLSLYCYGNTDHIGSHTKFNVDAKELFHLQLKGCVGTEDPDKAVEGIDYVAANYLTK